MTERKTEAAILSSGLYSLVAAAPVTHLSVRKNIRRHHTPRCPHQANGPSLSVLFTPPLPLDPHLLSSPTTNTNGEGKQQLQQHVFSAPVNRLQLSLFCCLWCLEAGRFRVLLASCFFPIDPQDCQQKVLIFSNILIKVILLSKIFYVFLTNLPK